MNTDGIIISLQQQLDLQKEENLNYINLISEQKQEIENLKNKIEFLEKEKNINQEKKIHIDNQSIISRMIRWIK